MGNFLLSLFNSDHDNRILPDLALHA